MSEHDEQVALFSILALYENKYPILHWIFAVPNGGDRHPAVAQKMKAEGVTAGVWDIFVPVVAQGCSGMFIEMKFGRNGLTEHQQEFLGFVKHDYKCVICYSSIEAAHVIGDYLEIEELRSVQ